MHEIMSASFQEYTNMCRYAANQATCEAFEQEMVSFLSSQYGVEVRMDLTEAKVYSFWTAVL